MKTIKDVLTASKEYLAKKGIPNARRPAEEVIAGALKLKRLDLYLDLDRPLVELELQQCRAFLQRRAAGEPIEYIIGEVEFFGCQLKVNPSVLIPRQETEILVSKIAENLAKEPLEGKIFWDVCCGSGCIGIAIKKRFPELEVVLSDLSEAALRIAKENAERTGVAVTFRPGDLLSPFQNFRAHFFACNPPYISEAEYATLDKEVKEREPPSAFIGGVTGLEFYQRLVKELPQFLYPSAKVWFEIGYQQGPAVADLFSSSPWINAKVEADWAGHDRFFSASFSPS